LLKYATPAILTCQSRFDTFPIKLPQFGGGDQVPNIFDALFI